MNKSIQNTLSVVIIIVFLILAYGSTEVSENSESDSNIKIRCDYTKVEIKAYEVGSDKLLDEKTLTGCFEKSIVDKSLNLIEIYNDSKTIKISYYNESTPNALRFLNVKIGEGEPVRWRANEGHDLFKTETNESLSFVFGDRKKSKVKGSIKFIK